MVGENGVWSLIYIVPYSKILTTKKDYENFRIWTFNPFPNDKF